MIRIWLIAATVLATVSLAFAQHFAPMVPQSAPLVDPGYGPMTPGALGPMIPPVTGNYVPPPPCSNKLDFTQACNSQYAGAIL